MLPAGPASRMAALEQSQAFIGSRSDGTMLTATALVMPTLASDLKKSVGKNLVKFPTSTGRGSDATLRFRNERRAGRSHVAALRRIPCVRAASIDLA
ncbi:MAG: hypothetical protein DWQ56_11260 [Microcystis aeruginosa DA14]|uniref:Uncharacterized protein n=1 Tax=Microcystis aeruginosa DA14 TaxID=1987506 RepID=A0A3E0MDH8_MICAE|nr:MAG: hypothetical protein DWQ56_11260 [Microcystis aeruginosa DA14]